MLLLHCVLAFVFKLCFGPSRSCNNLSASFANCESNFWGRGGEKGAEVGFRREATRKEVNRCVNWGELGHILFAPGELGVRGLSGRGQLYPQPGSADVTVPGTVQGPLWGRPCYWWRTCVRGTGCVKPEPCLIAFHFKILLNTKGISHHHSFPNYSLQWLRERRRHLPLRRENHVPEEGAFRTLKGAGVAPHSGIPELGPAPEAKS